MNVQGIFPADGARFSEQLTAEETDKYDLWKRQIGTHPGIFLFRSLSRITRTLTEVRAQRLQDLTEADAIAEGIEQAGQSAEESALWKDYAIDAHPKIGWNSPIDSYRSLWNSLHAKPKAVYGKDPATGEKIIKHHICHPWSLEDFEALYDRPVIAQSAVTRQADGSLTLRNPAAPHIPPTIIHPNPWVWALTYR